MGLLEFLGGMFGTRLIEIMAALLGLANVALIIRRSLWNYPFGLAMVVLYGWVFFDARLYSDALLQLYFFLIQIFGLVWWLRGRDDGGLVRPRSLPATLALLAAAGTAAGTVALGYGMATYTNADLPYWDAATTAMSVTAQFLMARRYVQSWLVWIAVDVLAIGIYAVKGLAPTAALYAVFLAMALAGYWNWQKTMGRLAAQPA